MRGENHFSQKKKQIFKDIYSNWFFDSLTIIPITFFNLFSFYMLSLSPLRKVAAARAYVLTSSITNFSLF